MHTLVDFITHVKGIEYILSVSAITGFLLFRDVLKPAPFRTVVNTGKDDLQFIGQSGGFSGVMKSEKTWSAGWASAWTRPMPTRIDLTIPVPAPDVCPHCGTDNLKQSGTIHEHVQEDIVLKPETVVTKYVHEEAYCPYCRRSVVGAGPNEIHNAPIGPVAKSTAGYLRYGIGSSYRKVQRIFEDLFGWPAFRPLWSGSTGERFVKELNAVCKRQLSFKPAETLRMFLVGPERNR